MIHVQDAKQFVHMQLRWAWRCNFPSPHILQPAISHSSPQYTRTLVYYDSPLLHVCTEQFKGLSALYIGGSFASQPYIWHSKEMKRVPWNWPSTAWSTYCSIMLYELWLTVYCKIQRIQSKILVVNVGLRWSFYRKKLKQKMSCHSPFKDILARSFKKTTDVLLILLFSTISLIAHHILVRPSL